ncbi:ABC transporter ATP-binding protein [Novosphingobium sp. P6W]|uniref:ABC transporter ATP-binding protein n=1 Tax=Novosphingobium sp. P6W TaxID=1609758 RepID=UPI0005C2D108|nr:ABC transporter ATP-binding protein [Novosphingobium sp. P6W]AXB77351.1 ABC transporter ATP-binding protein [Novosphingobium sp. P6W]KIS33733.1 ferrichrome ABC transporter ATP-binding protein [Novosphingobium sp. P6W]
MTATLGCVALSLADRLTDLTLSLHEGEVTAICGPNGAGKSTLLSCLGGLVAADGGLVTLGGRLMRNVPAQERAQCIGYLPQSPEIAWDVSVEVLVSLGRLPWGDAGAQAGRDAIQEAIAAMDLSALRDRRVSRLSGGERARALMARVLATRPAWLLADEPLANLDLRHAIALMRRFREQGCRGRGVVLVLHDLATAMNFADRVIVLDQGRLAADGEPAHALRSEVIEQVWRCKAGWLGERGMRALSLG